MIRTHVDRLSAESDSGALHVIVPHRSNWKLTEACVGAFARLAERRISITVVNNFDTVPAGLRLLERANLTLVSHSYTNVGRLVRVVKKENGSRNNALALDTALRVHRHSKWAFMAHNDSAPLAKGWDSHFFSALKGAKVVGNYRDRIRIHAAHSSGTLFCQEDFVGAGLSMQPEFNRDGSMRIDVGDKATEALHHRFASTPVPTLPNTINDPDTLGLLVAKEPLLAALAREGTCVSFDLGRAVPVFGHLGRGTPRSMNSSAYAHKMPSDAWIEFVNAL